MADIFVSYARVDKARVAPLVAALEAQGWSVWWDPAITPGQEFDRQISAELDAAKAVIVVWTPSSVDSRWVRGEAREAADRNILVPVRFENARLPIDARSLHTTDLDDWGEDPESAEFSDLARAISSLFTPQPQSNAATSSRNADDAVSIAVLPFADMSPGRDQDYFSDGLSEELINQLAQIKGLHVAGRTSCFAFKGKTDDLRLIGSKLGVNHVLEGSVRKAGNRLRITAQLIKCSTGFHLWSKNFDRELEDVFAIQEDVAKEVASALGITLGVGEAQMPGGTKNVEAYDLFLRALSLARHVGLADCLRAADLLHRALALDPEFAAAWLTLARVTGLAIAFGAENPERLQLERGQALERAIAIAPDLWSAHVARFQQLLTRRDWLGAEQANARARALAPASLPEPIADRGNFLGTVGRINEAIPCYQSVRRLDPLSTIGTLQGLFLDMAGRHAEAEAESERSKDFAMDRLLPEWFALLGTMAFKDRAATKQHFARYIATNQGPADIYPALLEVFDDAAAALRLIRRASDDPSPAAVQGLIILFAFWAAYFGDTGLALSILRRVYVDRGGGVIFNIWHPVFAEVRKAPGFKDLVRDLKLVDYWRSSGHWGDFARPLGDDDFEIIK